MVHASGESVSDPLPPHTFAVVLSVENESNLLDLSKKLKLGGIEHTLIEEVDAPYTGQATAIGIKPTKDRRRLKKYLSSLPLFGKQEVSSEE